MQAIKKTLDQAVAFITCSLLAVMVLVTLWQVFTRYVLNSPSTSSTEFLRYALIWESLLGSAYLFGKKQHLAITFFKQKFTGRRVFWINLLIEVVVIAFAVIVMVFGGVSAVLLTMEQFSPALHIAIGYIYLIIPLSGMLITIYSVINLAALITKKDIEAEHDTIESVM